MVILRILLCFLLGYGLGCLLPAAFFSMIMGKDLKEHGTGNLGATNATMVFGLQVGLPVMIFDMLKGYMAVWIAQKLFPEFTFSGVLAGTGAIIGHCFPFYLKFKGGKGLAAYGGMVLALKPILFPMLVVIALLMMLVTNRAILFQISAGLFFPLFYGFTHPGVAAIVIAAVAGLIIIFQNLDNIMITLRGEDIRTWDFMRTHLKFKKEKKEEETGEGNAEE